MGSGHTISWEVAAWLIAALFAIAAEAARRLEAEGFSRASGWLAFGFFAAGSLIWMFGDTYAYYFGQKEDALRISYWGSYREHEMWKEIVAEFRKLNPGVRVKQEYITDNYDGKVQQLLMSGDAPDVILFQDEPFPQFVDSRKFQCLDDYCARKDDGVNLDRDYWKTAVESFRLNGKVYGIPIWGGECMVIYNRTTFREAGVPEPGEKWTIDEFLDACKRITADTDGDGRLDRYGFIIPGWVYWLPFTYAFGAEYLDPSRTKWTLWGPEAEAQFTFWRDLRYKHHVSPFSYELTMGGDTAFMTNRAAMFISGPWAMPSLNEAGVDFDVAHIPSGPGGHGTRVTWDSLVMPTDSRKKELAWRFIRFATSLPAETIVAKYQRSVPALKAAREAFISVNPKVRTRRFIDAFEYARIQPITVNWQMMNREVASETDLMLDDKQTPRETLRRLAENIHLKEVFEMPATGGEGVRP